MTGRFRLVASLAMRDMLHERRLAICSLIGLAAVLAPLIVLFGLKHGVMEGLRSDLIENPRSRMIVNAANRNFDQAFFLSLRARPDIAFAIPRIRGLNTEARIERPDRPGNVVRAELLATDRDDPLLPGLSLTDPTGTKPTGTKPTGTDPPGTDPPGTIAKATGAKATDAKATDPPGTIGQGTIAQGTGAQGTGAKATDPKNADAARTDAGWVIPSASLAARLGLAPNMDVTLRAIRGDAGAREVLVLPVRIAAIAPPAAFGRDGMFVDPRLLLLVDGFTDGVLPATARPADIVDDPARIFAGFRAHARRLDDVIAIDHALRAAGVDVETQSEQVAGLLGLDRGLTLLFSLLAGLGGVGYLVSLAVGLYANVERKRRDLSLLRLVGLLRRDMILFPLLQSAAIGVAGALLAGGVALAVAFVVNGLPLGPPGSPLGGPDAEKNAICVLESYHLGIALLATLLGAMIAAAFAGARASRILPSEGLRDV